MEKIIQEAKVTVPQQTGGAVTWFCRRHRGRRDLSSRELKQTMGTQRVPSTQSMALGHSTGATDHHGILTHVNHTLNFHQQNIHSAQPPMENRLHPPGLNNMRVVICCISLSIWVSSLNNLVCLVRTGGPGMPQAQHEPG